MNSLLSTQHSVLHASSALLATAALALAGCTSSPPRPCGIGQPVTISASDTSSPSVVVDFFLPDGRTVSFPSAGTPSTVTSNSSGRVTVIAKTTDPEGAQDAQIWAAAKSCTTLGGSTSCSGPGLLGAPSASNPDARTAGMTGCTERLVQHNLQVFRDPTRDVSQEVTVYGKNFAGQQTQLGTFVLRAQ